MFFSIHRNRTFIPYNLIFGRNVNHRFFRPTLEIAGNKKSPVKFQRAQRIFPYTIYYTFEKTHDANTEQTRNNRHSWTISVVGGSRVCNSNDSIVSRKTPANSISKRFVKISWIQMNKINRNRIFEMNVFFLIYKIIHRV